VEIANSGLNKTVFVLLLCTIWLGDGFAQAKPSTFESCAGDFQDAFSKGGANVEKGLEDLRRCLLGQEFPSFTASSITGRSFSLSDFKNKVVLLNFWVINCAPCAAEMPLLNELYKEYKGRDFLL
jgi:thiol-disulfide isomerase/thioredoxin